MIKKKIIWIAALAAGALVCASCGGEVAGKKPVLPPEIQAGNTETKEIFTLDETGLFATVKNVSEIAYNQDIPQTYKDLGIANLSEKGVRVSGTGGATFYYTPVVNLNDLQGQNIVSFEAPHNDEFKIAGVTMEVIDIYDAQNKFTVTWFIKSNNLMSNVLIGCNGVSKGNNNESGYTLGYPRLEYGVTAYSVSFIEETRYGHLPFHFSYDMATAQVKGKFRETDSAAQMYLDLDNPVHMGEENVFDGFTTGEVYLKFIFDEVASGNTGAIVITDIAGKSLAGETLKAEGSDIIKLDMDSEYRSQMPVGEKGKPYAVPKAIHSDLFVGECNVGCQVTAPSGVSTVITDGVYTPTELGEYEVLYSTKDINGFNVMKKIYFDVVESVEALTLAADLENGAVLPAGRAVALPKVFAVGGSGVSAVETVYTFNGEKIIPDEDGYFTFADKGELKVTATAVDYLGTTAEQSFTYAVEETAKITLNAPLPKALTAGMTYYFPDFTGEVVGNSTANLEKSIVVNGETLAKNRKLVVPKSGVLTVSYTVGVGTEYETSKTFTINVVEASDTVDATKLFAVNESANVSTDIAGVMINATGKEARVDFVHAISANYAMLYFQPTDATKNFEYLEITLTDALNAETAVSFRVYKDTAMFDNFQMQNQAGEFAIHYRMSHTLAEAKRFTFYFDNDTRKIYNDNNIEIAPLKYTTAGKTFKGFEGGSMYVSVKLCNAAAGANICLAGLGNQSFDADLLAYGDLIKPQLATRSAVSDKTLALNSKYTVQKATALDVLQAKSNVKVSLLSPSGKEILDNASCVEDREFTLDELGNYKLTYSLEDGVSGTEKLEYILTVEDSIAPTITLKGEYKKTYRVGEKLKLLDVTVSDDISARENITLYVIVYPADYLPDYHKVGDKYLLATEGHYNVTYYAIDEAGNRGFAKFDIYVK